jgi:hypothetical protein
MPVSGKSMVKVADAPAASISEGKSCQKNDTVANRFNPLAERFVDNRRILGHLNKVFHEGSSGTA